LHLDVIIRHGRNSTGLEEKRFVTKDMRLPPSRLKQREAKSKEKRRKQVMNAFPAVAAARSPCASCHSLSLLLWHSTLWLRNWKRKSNI
jgi:hypothetical protein